MVHPVKTSLYLNNETITQRNKAPKRALLLCIIQYGHKSAIYHIIEGLDAYKYNKGSKKEPLGSLAQQINARLAVSFLASMRYAEQA